MTFPRRWNQHVQLADVFHDEDRSFTERRDVIIERLRPLLTTVYDPNDHADPPYELEELLDELAETRSVDEFDAVWDAVYDWADEHRIWIETIVTKKTGEAV